MDPRTAGSDVPEWCRPFFNAGQFRRFRRTLAAELARRFPHYRLASDAVEARGDEADEIFGFFNLAQTCAREPWWRYRATVASHLEKMVRSQAEREVPVVAEGLRIRFHPREVAERAQIVRPLTDDVRQVLSVETETSFRTLVRDDLVSLGMDESAAWAAAEWNHARDLSFERMRFDDADGGEAIHAWIAGDNFCVTTQASHLHRHLPEGEPGYLVGIPARHVLIAAPFRAATAIPTLQWIGGFVGNAYAKGPGSLSPGLFHVEGDAWRRVGCGRPDGDPEIRPLDEWFPGPG